MKKLLALLSCGLVALVAPAGAAPKQQKVEGTIIMPGVFAQGTFSGCWGGLTRRLTQGTGEDGSPANGTFGYRFKVDKATWNKPFVLEPTGGQGTVDLDIFLYITMPPPEDAVDDPVNGGTPVSVDYGDRKEGGEAGIVPKGATDAIVCLYGGPEYVGYDAAFTYTAGKGVKAPK
jgi:hypothetical protein